MRVQNDKLKNDLYVLATYFIAITLPFAIKVNSIFIIALTLASLTLFKSWQVPKTSYARGVLVFMVLFFVLYAISLLYSENLSEGAYSIEKKLSLLILPIVIGLNPLKAKFLASILKMFIISCFLAATVCIFFAIYRNTVEIIQLKKSIFYINEWFFSYHLLSSAIGIHAIYFSVYCSFCLLILLLQRLRLIKKSYFNNRTTTFLIVFFSVFIILLSSRIVISASFGIVVFILFLYYFKRGKIIKFILVVLTLMAFIVSLIVINPLSKVRFEEALNFKATYEDNRFGGRSLRVTQWKIAWEDLISRNIWTGVGAGDHQRALNAVYENRRLTIAHNFNLHNQYLDTLLVIGLPGLVVLLALLYISVTVGVTTRNLPYLVFIFLIISVSLTESFFGNQKGIVFFTFFSCAFISALKDSQ